MADQTLTLGTLFTANTTDFLAKTRRLESFLDSYARKAAKTKSAINKLARAHDVLGDKMDPLTKKIGKVTGAWNRLRSAAKVTASYGVAATAIFAVTGALKAGGKEIVEYDQALKNLEAITGATSAELGIMSDEIKRIAVDTKFSTTEIATGMVLLGQAGLSAAEATNAINAAAMLATGTLSNMQLTTDLLTTALRSFSLDAIESTRIADVMANAINKSKLTIDKLRIAFSYVGAVASQANLSLEETAAATMVLANNGLRASTIGTGLRQVLARLLAPNRKIREAYEQQGVSLEKLSPLTAGFQEAIKNLAPVLWDFTKKSVDMSKAFELFGLRGAQAAAIMVKEYTSGNYNRMLNSVYEVGSAAAMASIQQEGLGVMLKNLADRAGVFAIALGELGIVGALRLFIRISRDMLDALTLMAVNFKDAWDNLFNAQDLALRKSGEQIVATRRTVSSLEAYKGALESVKKEMDEGNDVTTKYQALLQRLIKDHPQLADSIDQTVDAYSGLDDVLKNVNVSLDENTAKISEGQLKRIELLNQKIADAKRRQESVLWFEKDRGETPLTRWYKDTQSMVDATKELAKEYEILANIIAGEVVGSETPLLAGETTINNLEMIGKLSEEAADIVRDKLVPALSSLNRESFIPDRMIGELKTLPKIFEDVYEKLEASEKWDFTKAYRRLQKEIASIRKEMAAEGKSQLFDILKRAREEAFLTEFLLKQEKKRLKPIQEAARLERRLHATKARLTTEEAEKIGRNREKELVAIRTLFADKLSHAKEYNKDVSKLNEEQRALELQANQYFDQKEIDLEHDKTRNLLEINALMLRAKNAMDQRSSIGSAATTKQLLEEQKADQIEYYQAIVDIEKQWYEETVKIYGEGHEETLKSKKALTQAVVKLTEFETKVERAQAKERIKERKKELNAKLKSLKKYSEEWFEIMRQMRALGEGTEFEAQENIKREKALKGTWFDQLRYGFENSKVEAQSWGEQIIEIGEKMSDSFGKAWTSFTTGSRTASEAMGDFIKRSIEGLSELIIKQIFYNALVAAMPGLFGGAGGTSPAAPATAGTPYPVPVGLAGGGWIREPIVGRGLRTGRRYELGEKGAEYVTPAGKMGAMNIKVVVNNNTGTKAKVRTEGPRFNGAEMVMTIWLDAVNRNAFNSRDIIKGISNG